MNKIVIEKEYLDHNLNLIKNHLKNNCKDDKVPNIIAVVKGNAYGLGLEEFSNYLHGNGIDTFRYPVNDQCNADNDKRRFSCFHRFDNDEYTCQKQYDG